MRRAIRAAVSVLGIVAGAAGMGHGIFETLQGNVRPDSLMIASMGPPCQPDTVWHLCEPAMTIVPSYLVTGILAIVVGLAVLVWSAAFVQRRSGGLVLMALSVVLLLVGGGIFPPLIGLVGGAAGTRINVPLSGQRVSRPGGVSRILARLWPWPLVACLTWLFGQWIIGTFLNEFLLQYGLIVPVFVIGLLLLGVFSARAYDVHRGDRGVAVWDHLACFLGVTGDHPGQQ